MTSLRLLIMKNDLHFKYLPAYAEYLSKNKVKDFTIEQLRLIKEFNVPLFKYYVNYSDDDLINQGITRTETFLKSLSENNVSEYINSTIQEWLANQIPLILKENILPEDITLISFIRRKLFRFHLPFYTSDIDLSLKIMNEVDMFTVHLDSLLFKHLLELQHSLFEQAQTLAHIGNWSLDLSTKKLLWTKELFKIYGLEPTIDANSYDLRSFIHPNDRELVDEQQESLLNTLSPTDFYFRIVLKDGTLKYLNAKCELLVNEGDKPITMFGTLQDVTKIKLAKLELQNKNIKLEQANKELESFSYIASHDLQEPLRKIQAFSGRLLQKEHEVLSDWGKDVFGRIISAANRMQKLIEDLLSFSRLDKSNESLEKTDINVLLKEVKNNLGEVVESKNAIIEIGIMPIMNVVPFHFHQLFTNLINNSLKYSKPDVDPIIKISSEIVEGFSFSESKKYYHIKLIDNGIGFDQQYSKKIFELFQRLHGKAEYEGTGIGLAICKKIVENHHGIISAEGEFGVGAKFNMYFPVE